VLGEPGRLLNDQLGYRPQDRRKRRGSSTWAGGLDDSPASERRDGGLNTLAAIEKRRSIRRFNDDPVPDGALHAILTAAAQAPSAKNRQPWRFLVVTGEQRSEMVRLMREGMDKMVDRGEDRSSGDWAARAME
jgi:hypothetical protein